MNIVILYTTIGHYMYATINSICELNQDANVHVVYDDKHGVDKNYNKLEEINRVKYIPKSSLSKVQLYNFIVEKNPHLLYFPAWQDREYFHVVKKIRRLKNKTIFIGGFDDIWFGRLRQVLGSIYFRLFYRKYFDYAWISGKPQYSYAQRMGFDMETIINDLYCADTNTFNAMVNGNRQKRFLFVGRFVKEKGLDVLLDAYEMLDVDIKEEWNLCLIGSGSLLDQIQKRQSNFIKIIPYLQKEELKVELQKGGVCVIPSNKDQWGLPVHEMALSGYPLIVSSAVGSSSEFLISGLNGYKFKKGSVQSLYNALSKITSLSEQELNNFGAQSQKLGARINSQFSAASFLSVIEFD